VSIPEVRHHGDVLDSAIIVSSNGCSDLLHGLEKKSDKSQGDIQTLVDGHLITNLPLFSPSILIWDTSRR
jgi:hypothetical protein